MSKIELKDSKFQFIELLNEKADKTEVERLKTNKLDIAVFDNYKDLAPNDDKLGKKFRYLII